MVRLEPSADPFLVETLKEVLTLFAGDKREWLCCQALVEAVTRRRAREAIDVLCRIALDREVEGWLPVLVIQLLEEWDPHEFAPLFREAATTCSSGFTRSWAAEMLVTHGNATPEEIDAFLADPDEGVHRLTARGLARRADGDAISRLVHRASSGPDSRARHQAFSLLRGMNVFPGRGGQC